MALDHSCQVQRHTNAARGLDLYETPPMATEALLRAERIPRRVWEPAAGRGAIVKVLRAAGHEVYTSDIVQRDFKLDAVGDFLKMTAMPPGCEALLTNPPFQWAEEFVAHALKLSPLIVMFLRLAFLESERRSGILENRGLARVHVFRKRIPMMHRAGWEGRKGNSGMAFAWFVWERAHRGPATINRISWERPEPPALREDQQTKSNHSKEGGQRHLRSQQNARYPGLRPKGGGQVSHMETDMVKKAVELHTVPTTEAVSIPKPGEFSLDKFKSKRASAVAGVETLQTALPHHKIADAKDFVRLHPDEKNYWSEEICFVNVPIKGQKRDTLHLITEDLAMGYLPDARILRLRLALATKPFDIFFLCQVPTQNEDNAWNSSNLQACELAKTKWVQVSSRKGEGVEAYKIDFAKDQDAFPEPKWPTQSLDKLIEKTFAGRLIVDERDPGLLRLIGARQST